MVEPAHLHIPPRAGSLGEKVALVCASVGRDFDEEQRLAADVLMSVNAAGMPAALEGAVVSARQNLKTFVLEGIVLTKLLEPDRPGLPPFRLGIWSSQLFDTAQESFRNFDELFAGFSHLSRRVKKVHRGNGEEEFELKGHGDGPTRRLKFKARSKSGGRGLSGDFVVLDEAFALQPGHMGALLPTLSTRRRAHVLYGSSAGLPESAVLRGVRDRGRAGGKDAPAYIEWCAPGSLDKPTCERRDQCPHRPGVEGCALDREELWLLANPALGRRITVDYLRAERLALTPEEFARERLGWWDAPDEAGSRITVDDWSACALDKLPKVDGRPVFFLDASPGLASASIGVAATASGKPHLEVADHRSGAGWLAGRAKKLKADHPGARFALLGTGAVSALLPDLAEAGLEPDQLTNQDMGRGCAHLQKLVADRAVTHSGDPLLVQALSVAAARDIGDDLWTWSRRKSGDISPLVAVTGAAWLLRNRPSYDVMMSFLPLYGPGDADSEEAGVAEPAKP
jgi:hypothetical protein